MNNKKEGTSPLFSFQFFQSHNFVPAFQVFFRCSPGNNSVPLLFTFHIQHFVRFQIKGNSDIATFRRAGNKVVIHLPVGTEHLQLCRRQVVGRTHGNPSFIGASLVLADCRRSNQIFAFFPHGNPYAVCPIWLIVNL